MGKLTEYRRKYYEEHKEAELAKSKAYREAHKEYYLQYRRAYNKSHREQLRKNQNERYKTDPNFRIATNLRCRVKAALKGKDKIE